MHAAAFYAAENLCEFFDLRLTFIIEGDVIDVEDQGLGNNV